MESSKNFTTEKNNLKMEEVKYPFQEGVELDKEEQLYLLPHFLMLLIGKPGSGKSAMLKQLLNNKQMYRNKFDHIFFVSPSFAKMELKLKPANMTSQFSLPWIYKKIEEINVKQNMKTDSKGKHLQLQKKADKSVSSKGGGGDRSNRLIGLDILEGIHGGNNSKASSKNKKGAVDQDQEQLRKQEQANQLTAEQKRMFYTNVLFIFDDAVADIKKQETNPQLGQLIMNRRHLITNGMISIIIVSQKYTLIPARIRSNANWLLLFKLNPIDIENVFKDVITLPRKVWEEITAFVFGGDIGGGDQDIEMEPVSQQSEDREGSEDHQEEDEELFDEHNIKEGGGGGGGATKKKKEEVKGQPVRRKSSSSVSGKKLNFVDRLEQKRHDNLGVWVEFNELFKNFQRIVSGD